MRNVECSLSRFVCSLCQPSSKTLLDPGRLLLCLLSKVCSSLLMLCASAVCQMHAELSNKILNMLILLHHSGQIQDLISLVQTLLPRPTNSFHPKSCSFPEIYPRKGIDMRQSPLHYMMLFRYQVNQCKIALFDHQVKNFAWMNPTLGINIYIHTIALCNISHQFLFIVFNKKVK